MFLSLHSKLEVEKPLRGDILSRDALALSAIELAEFYSAVSDRRLLGVNLRSRFKKNTKGLRNAYFEFSAAAKNKEVLTAGAEWLLDNYHVIEEQVREISRDLPKSYYRSLPKLQGGEWDGFPRVYRLVCEYLTHTDSSIDQETLAIFVQAYQSRSVLKIGEIWAIPIMLRLALVENLRRLASSSLRVRQRRARAEQLCHQMLSSTKSTSGSELLVSLVQRVSGEEELLREAGAYILKRLRSKGSAAALALQWFDARLRELNLDSQQLEAHEQSAQAADQLSFGNCVTSLKTLGTVNWREWFERVSQVDRILANDPARVYDLSDFTTRDLYRQVIERLSERSRRPEIEVAERLVEYARNSPEDEKDPRTKHVGYYLIDEGFRDFEGSLSLRPELSQLLIAPFAASRLALYLGAIALLTIGGALLIFKASLLASGSFLLSLIFSLLIVLPLNEAVILAVQALITKLLRPQPLPKLDFDKAIPEAFRTVVTIQALIHDRGVIEELVEALEIRALSNLDANLSFGILADFPDASAASQTGDYGLEQYLGERLTELNQRYDESTIGRFFGLLRPRTWNESEQRFMGWERKRGKIEQFNRLIVDGDQGDFRIVAGSLDQFKDVKFVITLDSDTRLPAGTARKLAATIAHPLNRPILDERNVVVKGYGLIQPRMGITLDSATASHFASAFSGQSGIDPYTRTISDVYQDLFREGSYIGKGIYEVAAFDAALRGRVPPNALLSHDLFEGCLARCGLASDIELLDDFPSRYIVQAKRQHRWIRGDWQLLPWVIANTPFLYSGVKPSPVSGLGRWKLFDNLRRSLVPLSAMLSFVPLAAFDQPLWALGVAMALFFVPLWLVILNATIDFCRDLLRAIVETPIKESFAGVVASLSSQLWRTTELCFYNIIFLPHQAFMVTDAIAVTLGRLFFTRRSMLEWETAHITQRRFTGDLRSFVRAMVPSLLFVLPVLALLEQRPASLSLVVLCALWISSPAWAWQLSQHRKSPFAVLSKSDKEYLRSVAFDTWCYFRRHLLPEYNYLIPDNLQVVPRRVVAERTSPTNISLSCLSVVSACDFGFILVPDAIDRVYETFLTLQKMERFHGHFLNWYDIRRLTPLAPRYVSTVDSGNMLGHFFALKQAFRFSVFFPLLSDQHIEFFVETSRNKVPEVDRLRRCYVEDLALAMHWMAKQAADPKAFSSDRPEVRESYVVMQQQLFELIGWVDEIGCLEKLPDLGAGHKKFGNIRRLLTGRTATLSFLYKLTNRLLTIESQIDLNKLDTETRIAVEKLLDGLRRSNHRLKQIGDKAQAIIRDVDLYVREADFKFLLHPQKKLFAIGYNVDSGHKDDSCYDLLASEARLASLVAIAKHDVPTAHWFLLGRSLTNALGGRALLSWSGTMFEYLMPLLVTKDYENTLLNRTHKAIVRTQIAYGRIRGVPWGISESAFSGVDFEKTYQYRAFGIPGLGLKRGLAHDLVISPYSTAMALLVDPLAGVKNLQRLDREGLRSEFGFFEAADYTKERLGADETRHIVRSFLAHHQGMSLIGIANVLNNGVFQQRFHSEPMIQSIDLLLQERFPDRVRSIIPHQAELQSLGTATGAEQVERAEHIMTPFTANPRTHLISNGRYTVMMNNVGSGFSLGEGDISLTRWTSDAVLDHLGTFIYVRDLANNRFWSATYQPTKVEPLEYEAIFNPDKIEYIRRDGGIRLHTEIAVSPEDPVEVRRITVTNLSRRRRELDLTSYAEAVLAPDKADKAHPAFSKLFIETEFVEDYDALLISRRPRSASEKPLFFFQLVAMPIVWAPLQFETDRHAFIGRGRNLTEPAAMVSRNPLGCHAGTVLDPIVSLRSKVEVEPGASETLNFVSGVTRTREEALALIKRYHESYHISRAFEMAWSHSDVEIRDQQFPLARIRDFQQLATGLLYNIEALRAPSDLIAGSELSQAGLWRLGVSGDEPLVLLVLNDTEQVKLAEETLLAHEYLGRRGLRFDLVIINDQPGGYLQNLRDELDFIVKSGYARNLLDQRGGVFIRGRTQISPEEEKLLYTAARVVLTGDRGSLSTQLKAVRSEVPAAFVKHSLSTAERKGLPKPAIPIGSREFDNGTGGFVNAGKSYAMTVGPGSTPPQPWSNVVANEQFGFLVTESGGGYTWFKNSRESRLTPWSNDPVCDPMGEVLYIRDLESGEYWTPTPRPAGPSSGVQVEHSFGHSVFSSKNEGIKSNLTISSSNSEAVKWWHLELQNTDAVERKLEVYLYLEWVMGVTRDSSFRFVQTGMAQDAQVLYARCPWNVDFSKHVAFVGSNLTIQSYTCSRSEFMGRCADYGSPGVFESNSLAAGLGQILPGAKSVPVLLSGATGGGLDACTVAKVQVMIPPGGKQRVLFFMGATDSMTQLKPLAASYRSLANWSKAYQEVRDYWNRLTTTIEVKTPERSFDILVNGWLLYQTLSCRMHGRTGFYQSSGALGFRDQLQDSLAWLMVEPSIPRKQILLHASRQFPEGDVQHWWHPPLGRGIRTKISDNYLWLPFAVSRYLETTGDTTILDEQVHYLDGPQIEEGHQEFFFQANQSALQGPLYEHCIKALDRSFPVGPHGLPLMGCGDWNDGMNQVGVEGKGESVWLGWFLASILRDFAPVCESKGDHERAARYREHSQQVAQAIESHAWDGHWYRRAYFDDGTPIGSSANAECKIDSLAQSWSAITRLGTPSRQTESMREAIKQLVDPENKILKLLTPPFQHSVPSPGYIQGYPEGIRENGGQYTHGSVWLVMAAAVLGWGDEAVRLFEYLNPINHGRDEKEVRQYQTEPYVTCGDVYSHPSHPGRGGWSWYTGSSGWLYQVAIQHILGFQLQGDTLVIKPSIPASWPEFSMTARLRGRVINVQVKNPNKVSSGVRSIKVNNEPAGTDGIPLSSLGPEGQPSTVVVELG